MLNRNRYLHNLRGLLLILPLFISCRRADKQNVIEQDKIPLNSIFKFPLQQVEGKYKKLIGNHAGFNSSKVDIGSISIILPEEMFSPQNFQLFRFSIFNGAHYEYNNGVIKCIALVSQVDSNDIRILFPKSYARGSADFFKPFLNVGVSNKVDYCTHLTNLINDNIAYQIKNVEFVHSSKKNSLLVVSKSKIDLYHLLNEKSFSSYIQLDSVLFIFKNDTLINFISKDTEM